MEAGPGACDHGAPVCAAWSSTVGTHGAKSSAAPPKATRPPVSSARRRGPATATSISQASPAAAPKNSPQLCAYSTAARATANVADHPRWPGATTNARRKAPVARRPHSSSSEYMRSSSA
jgi:hypothetical protein